MMVAAKLPPETVDRAVVALAGMPDVLAAADRALLRATRTVWDRSWQPADIAHVARRKLSQRAGRLAVTAVGAEASASGAFHVAPAPWTEQLDALGLSPDAPIAATRLVESWGQSESLDLVTTVADAVRVISLLSSVGPIQELIDPPSRWGRKRTTVSSAVVGNPKMLAKIRALLAKAESTDFPEEAESFTAKAQELMARHAIDRAVLHASGDKAARGAPIARRIHIDDPYARAKVQLLSSVGDANTVSVVWTEAYGFATVVGFADDIDGVEVLFTSLLVQANHAVAVAGRIGQHERTVTYRKAFLMSFAIRIGQRLREATAEAFEAAAAEQPTINLLPVLADRKDAVEDEFTRMFPNTIASRGGRFNTAGWNAGRAAADQASFGNGHDRLSA
jgi:hypothetical protein